MCRLLDLPEEFAAAAQAAARQFPLFVPRGFVARMRPGDPDDPLLRQVLPLADEMADVPGFVADPVGDDAADAAAGPAAEVSRPRAAGRRPARAPSIAATVSAGIFRTTRRRARSTIGSRRSTRSRPTRALHEVILSGGDPLTLVDATLAELVEQLADIPHLRRLRIHTRLPIVIPERVTDELIDMLRGSRLTPIVVVHANHANELDAHVAAALG